MVCIASGAETNEGIDPGIAESIGVNESATRVADSLGPLLVRPTSLGQSLRFNPAFPSNLDRDPSTWRLDASLTWGNLWGRDNAEDTFIVDGEWTFLDFYLSRNLSENFQLGVGVPLVSTDGGFADGFIEDTHDAFGVRNFGREKEPEDRKLIQFVNDDGVTHTVEGSSSGLGDVSLFALWQVAPDREKKSAFAWHAAVTFPTGDEEELHGNGEIAAQAGFRWRKALGDGDWVFHLIGQGGYSLQDELLGIEVEEIFGAAIVGVEWHPAENWSFLIQGRIASPWAVKLVEFSDPVYELLAGGKLRVGKASLIEFSIIENVINFRNSTDVGAALAWSTAL